MDVQAYSLAACVSGGLLLLTTILCSLIGVAPAGIPLVAFESAGVALVCFSVGLLRQQVDLFIFFAVGVVMAIFVDPFIWRKQKLLEDGCCGLRTSLLLNGAVGTIGGFAYLFGLLFRFIVG
jgi:hypothetical protein